MKYYKLDNQVFAFAADGSQDDYIKPEMVLMTANEVLFHQSNDGTATYDSKTDSIIIDNALVATKKLREQDEAWELIKERRLLEVTSGVYVPSIGKHFHTDDVSAIQYAQIGITISLGMFEPLNWKTVEGDFVMMTEALFKEFQTLMIQNTQANYARAEYHKVMMQSVDNPLDYDYSAGWV